MDPLGEYDLPPDHGFELNPGLEKELPFDAVFHLSKGEESQEKTIEVDGVEYVETTTSTAGEIRLAGVCFGIIRAPRRKPFTSAIKLSVTSPEEWAGCLAICWFNSSPGGPPGVVEIRPGEEDPIQ